MIMIKTIITTFTSDSNNEDNTNKIICNMKKKYINKIQKNKDISRIEQKTPIRTRERERKYIFFYFLFFLTHMVFTDKIFIVLRERP